MTRALITESLLTDIADAIRGKNGASGSYTPAQMATAIEALETEKCGITLDGVVGDVSGAGNLQVPNAGNLVVTGFTNCVSYALAYKFYRNSLTSATFPDITTLSTTQPFAYCFNTCTHLTSVSFPKLKTLSGTTAMQYMCYGDTALTSVSFPKLEVIGVTANSANYRHFYYAFYNCSALTEVRFPELTTIYCNGTGASYGTFSYAFNKSVKLYFPKLATIAKGTSYTNETAAKNIFSNCTSITEIHFGSANQSSITASAGYSSKWGATNATIVFDL